MKQSVIIILFLLQCSLLMAQQEKRYIKKGNDLYSQQKNIRRLKLITANRLKRIPIVKKGRTWRATSTWVMHFTSKRNLLMPARNLTSLPGRRTIKL